MRLFFIVLLAAVVSTHAQIPQVPHKMEFGGMTLTIREDARREIQKDVNALTQSPRHHNIKVERAKTYFPIIEKVFQEERIPEDFKYLVLQESALIADAVSVSNAVGFWQFKDFTAVEMGLRVDKEVDERLNIVSSSRAAARYIKKNNFHFNNWLFALQAYQMGAGGAMKALPKNLSGARNMEITSSTYWYVKKFLAHKVAFEDAVKGDGQIKAIPYVTTGKKSLSDVAREVSVNEDEIREYNKWAKKGHIPDDRSYTVIIPLIGEGTKLQLPEPVIASAVPKPVSSPTEEVMAERTTINGIRAIKPKAGESVESLAGRAKVSLRDFLVWNDISQSSSLDPNQYYLLSKKRKRADEAYHQVKEGETLWTVSQNHGVEMKRLMRFNRLKRDEEITAGTTLWLSSKKPKNADQNVEPGEVIEIDNSTSFAWASSNQTNPTTEVATPVVDNMQDKSTTQAPGSSATVLESTPNLIDSVETLQVPQVASTVRDSAEDIAIPVKDPTIKMKDHVVQQKETLYGIAKQYSVGVMELVEWNDLNLQDGIRPGQILRLYDADAVQPEPTASILIEHEVKTTDTLYSIARRYGVTIQQLMEWNEKKDFTLAIGEKLKIQGR
jgi:membrane-bound lytic murein transglycosylase D